MRLLLLLLAFATACSAPEPRDTGTNGRATDARDGLAHGPVPGESARGPELVQGLLPGEGAREVEAVRDDELAELRVVDAATCLPLEGARVETWTEDGTPPAMLPVLVGDARTGADGSVRVRWRIAGAHASNFRISKGGFESKVTASPLGETVWLQRAAPLRGRVLDLDLQPVADAVVRTRQCCAHAISAASTRTDDDGFFVLDDVPVGEDEGAELEVVAARHSSRAELEPLVLRQIGEHDPLSAGHGAAVLVSRAAPWRARLLDLEGRPLAHRRVGSPNWRPSVATWTDAEGTCTLPPPDGFSRDVETMDAGPKLHYLQSALPSATLVDVWPSEARPAKERRVELELVASPGEEARALTARTPDSLAVALFPFGDLQTEWPAAGATVAQVGAGPTTIVLGRDFSGWCEELHELLPGPPPEKLRLTPRLERPLKLVTPRWDPAALFVQSTADGFVDAAWDWSSGLAHELFVPPACATIVCCESPRGELRRVRFDAGTAPASADLTAETARLRPAFTEHETERARETPETLGFPPGTTGVTGTLWPAGEGSSDFADGGFELPRGRWFFAELGAPGFCPVRVLRRAGEPASMQAVRSARVRVTGDARRVEAFGRELDALEGAEHGFEYAGVPGPLRLLVTRADDRVLRIDLELAPGAERELVLR